MSPADGMFFLQCAMIHVFIEVKKVQISTLAEMKDKKKNVRENNGFGTARVEKSIDEILQDLKTSPKKKNKVSTSKNQKSKKKIKVGKSVPRIVKVQNTKGAVKYAKNETTDETSVTMNKNNKYHKRFTKTKKPGRV